MNEKKYYIFVVVGAKRKHWKESLKFTSSTKAGKHSPEIETNFLVCRKISAIWNIKKKELNENSSDLYKHLYMYMYTGSELMNWSHFTSPGDFSHSLFFAGCILSPVSTALWKWSLWERKRSGALHFHWHLSCQKVVAPFILCGFDWKIELKICARWTYDKGNGWKRTQTWPFVIHTHVS